MKPEELKLLIAEGECLTVEFKESYSSKISRDIVAFSNTKGGCLLLGVGDNGKIINKKPTKINRLKAEIVNIGQNCEPQINIKEISQVGNVVAVEVCEGEEKPYSCSEGYFRRLDAVTQKMTQKEVPLLHTPITKEVKQIRGFLGCSQETLADIVGVGTRTIVRWEHNESHPHQLAIEKFRKIEKLIQKLSEVFESQQAIEWLNTPNQSLGGRTPLKKIMHNGEGIEEIINLLGAIEWGIVT